VDEVTSIKHIQKLNHDRDDPAMDELYPLRCSLDSKESFISGLDSVSIKKYLLQLQKILLQYPSWKCRSTVKEFEAVFSSTVFMRSYRAINVISGKKSVIARRAHCMLIFELLRDAMCKKVEVVETVPWIPRRPKHLSNAIAPRDPTTLLSEAVAEVEKRIEQFNCNSPTEIQFLPDGMMVEAPVIDNIHNMVSEDFHKMEAEGFWLQWQEYEAKNAFALADTFLNDLVKDLVDDMQEIAKRNNAVRREL